MGIMDAFNAEDRVQVKVSQLYVMLREAAKCELLMNAVNCNVPHSCIRAMATGEKESVITHTSIQTIEIAPTIEMKQLLEKAETLAKEKVEARNAEAEAAEAEAAEAGKDE